MEEITIKAEYLFEFTHFQNWVNTAKSRFEMHGLSGKDGMEKTVCIDVNGNAVTCGYDFAIVEKKETFPVKVYRLVRAGEGFDKS